MLPSAHGEGRPVASDELLDALESQGQVAMRYHEADDFNGSMRRIAGICDSSGSAFGHSLHPERFTRWTQHPHWIAPVAPCASRRTLGLRMFRNAVQRAPVGASTRGPAAELEVP